MKTAHAIAWPGAADPPRSFRSLLSDGSGPCYVRIRSNALTDALHEISQWLAVPQ
jgi:hypothetical protein